MTLRLHPDHLGTLPLTVARWGTVRCALQPGIAHDLAPSADAGQGAGHAAVARQPARQRPHAACIAYLSVMAGWTTVDGSQKLPQRLLGTVRDRLRDRQSVARLGLAVAAWLHFLRGATIGQRLDREAVGAMLGHAPVFGDLAGRAPLVDAVFVALQSLALRGVAGTLRQWAESGASA